MPTVQGDLRTNNPLVKRLSAAISGLLAYLPSLQAGEDSSAKLHRDWLHFAIEELPFRPDTFFAAELKGFAARHKALWESAGPTSNRGPGPVQIGTDKLLISDLAEAVNVIDRAWEAEQRAIENAAKRAARAFLAPALLVIGVLLAFGYAKRGG